MRIVGGQDAVDKQFPFVASLRNEYGIHYCGAIIISSNWLLTTATCFTKVDHTKVFVTVGANKLSSVKKEDYLKIDPAVIHKDYNSVTREHNVALFRTKTAIQYNERIQPAKLSTDEVISDEDMVVTGWGRNEQGLVPDNLQFVHTHLMEKSECQNYIKNLHDGEICAVSATGSGACIGDQGGPLLLSDNSVAAILSFTITTQCGADFPDGYQTIHQYLTWIDTVTTNKK